MWEVGGCVCGSVEGRSLCFLVFVNGKSIY